MAKNYIAFSDLGTQQDYTTFGVLDVMTRIERDDRVDEMLFSRPSRSLIVNYGLVKLERYPLKITYPKIVAKIRDYMNSEVLYNKTMLVADASGVGIAVVQLMRSCGLSPFGIASTSGGTINKNKDIGGYNVPKKVLVGFMSSVLQQERLIISKDIQALDQLKKEIMNFQMKITQSNNMTFENARDSIHDDLVAGLMLGIFCGEYILGGQRRLEDPDDEPEIEENYDVLRTGVLHD